VLGAGILEQVVGEVHKNVLKTMLCSYFTKNNRLSLYLRLFITIYYNTIYFIYGGIMIDSNN